MSVLLIIPARYASSRFPGKALARLTGRSGVSKSLVHRTWEAAVAAQGIDRVVVATEGSSIREEVASFGGEVVITSPRCRNGTERCADAMRRLGGSYDIIVNLQGDSPLTPPWFIEDLVAAMRSDLDVGAATPAVRCSGGQLGALLRDRRDGRIGGTTVVFDRGFRALYFSKEVIPWSGETYADEAPTPVFHHIGLYAYTPDVLDWYIRLRPGILEMQEGLEQLRLIENGQSILCVEVDSRGRPFWEVNNLEDIERVEQGLAAAGIE